ncbi:MAG TPA: type II toxin-antitoxin system RelE/ParE family toxin [Terriglobia bacterium]|nr:type II toxin-antitoxin system RelE/ParE family toxin [Terriglobia bacterium]
MPILKNWNPSGPSTQRNLLTTSRFHSSGRLEKLNETASELFGLLPRAQKELAELPTRPFGRVCDAIRALAESPRPSGCLKLSGREGWRFRVGDYRVVYEINDQEKSLTVLHVGHRSDVYR